MVPRLPVLSEVACNVLAVPISTVPLESAFSTGDLVLDVYRSSLSPRMVESLICGKDWLIIDTNGVPHDIFEDAMTMDELENDIYTSYTKFHLQFFIFL